MQPSRLPRFKRAFLSHAMELTERDREIIRLVYRHRFLRSSHVCSLIPGSSQQLLRRLKLLYHHGFLERPRSQLDYYHKDGSREIVYGLGNKGAAVLKEETDAAIGNKWSDKNRSIGRIFLEHALLVSDVMVAIELACRETGIRLITERELALAEDMNSKSRRFRWKVNVDRGVKLGVIPDRVFALEYQDQSSRSERAYFFLEADRGTMPVIREGLSQTSFYRKLLAYEATWRQNLHRTRFAFHRFRVLTVTRSVARVNSLVKACSKLERGHGLFLFADNSVLKDPDLLFASVWQLGRQGEKSRLL